MVTASVAGLVIGLLILSQVAVVAFWLIPPLLAESGTNGWGTDPTEGGGPCGLSALGGVACLGGGGFTVGGGGFTVALAGTVAATVSAIALAGTVGKSM